ncbi:PilZ domain-containing protein [Alteromonadaceae bacterium BrNp21-10]|nr:PilZ domain-containing protein [Alteromonadaceae bacterium BrNp21-10]
MNNLSLEQKQQQFHEFFMIKHPLLVNMTAMAADFELPSPQQFIDNMPHAFRIATEVSQVEAKTLRPLRKLGEHAEELVAFLNQQSRKIDLIMSIVLQQQDDPQHRFSAVEFGGGGVVLTCPSAIAVGTIVELKLFLNEEASAVYCLGEVITCEAAGDQYHVSSIFTRIRDEDQEQLVRATLHLQTQQLKKRRTTE